MIIEGGKLGFEIEMHYKPDYGNISPLDIEKIGKSNIAAIAYSPQWEAEFLCEKLYAACQAIDEMRELQEATQRELFEAISNGVTKTMKLELELKEVTEKLNALTEIICGQT